MLFLMGKKVSSSTCFTSISWLLPTSYLIVAMGILVYRHSPFFKEPEGMFEISTSNFILGYMSLPGYPLFRLIDYLWGSTLTGTLMQIVRLGNNVEIPFVHVLVAAVAYWCIGYGIKSLFRRIRLMRI